jgi:hypothetical protein
VRGVKRAVAEYRRPFAQPGRASAFLKAKMKEADITYAELASG